MLIKRVHSFFKELTELGVFDEMVGRSDLTHPDVINSLCDDVAKNAEPSRPNYDRCDEGLQRAIDVVADNMLADVWNHVFVVLDSVSGRFILTSEDAGRLAQICVNAIKNELPECLAK